MSAGRPSRLLGVFSRAGGGKASRFEVYALFLAAVVLIGGGVSGALIVTNNTGQSDTYAAGASASAARRSAYASRRFEATTSTAVTTTAAPTTTAPTTTAAPATVAEPPPPSVGPSQPVQEVSAYCTIPNMIGTHTDTRNFIAQGLVHVAGPQTLIVEAGCQGFGMSIGWSACITSALPANQFEVLSQDPAGGTLVHKTLGRVSWRVALPLAADPDRARTDWPNC